MRSSSHSSTIVVLGRTRRRFQSVGAVCMIGLLSACLAPPPPWNPATNEVLAPLDSAALARETGRRDARVVHRPRTAAASAALIGTFAMEFSVLVRRPGTGYWVAPVSIVSVSAGSALWAYRETKQPIPAPPDSMRSRYGLYDARLWRSYGDGFREAIDDQRRTELERDSRSALVTAIVFAGTFAALRRR